MYVLRLISFANKIFTYFRNGGSTFLYASRIAESRDSDMLRAHDRGVEVQVSVGVKIFTSQNRPDRL
jgi:hypothetical protein